MSQLRLTPSLSTHQGMRRKSNQDAVGYHYPTNETQLQQYGVLFAVADGVGSLAAGEKASRTAIDKLIELYYAAAPNLSPEARLAHVMQEVNQIIHTLPEDAATTLVVAIIIGDQLTIGSVGDSLAYRVRPDRIDKLVQEDVLEDTSGESKKSRLTRAIGYRATLEVETLTGTIQPGDRILLCSDGLSRYMDEARLQSHALLDNPRSAVLRMVSEANDKGGADNISVILVQVGDELANDAIAKHVKGLNAYVSVNEEPMMFEPTMTKPMTRLPDAPATPVPPARPGAYDAEEEVLNTKPASQFPDAPVVPDTQAPAPTPQPQPARTRQQASVPAQPVPPTQPQQPATPATPQRNILPLILIALGVILLIIALLVVPDMLAYHPIIWIG